MLENTIHNYLLQYSLLNKVSSLLYLKYTLYWQYESWRRKDREKL